MSPFSFHDNVKINLETTTRCGGSCQGCMLGSSERRHAGLWSAERLASLLPMVQEFIRGHLEHFDPVEVSFNCGQGDHLLADHRELQQLIGWMAEAGQGRAIGFLTASAVGRSERVFAAVDTIREASLRLNQPVLLDVVFDPVKTTLAGFRDTYVANLDYIRSAFGEVDFSINVGPDTIAAVSPADLHAFIKRSGIRRFTMNLTPTLGSAATFTPAWDAIIAWAVSVVKLWNPADGYEINLGQVLATMLEASANLSPGSAELNSLIALSASRSIYIDAEDWLWHTQEGLGDIAFSRRIGWRPSLALPLMDKEVHHQVNQSARRFTAHVMRPFHTNRTCLACPFATTCPRIGIAALHGTIAGKIEQDDCPTGVRPLLETFARFQAEGSLGSRACKKDYTHLPAGFAADSRPHAIPVEAGRQKLDFAALEMGESR